jgi:hypothetical protein
MGEGSCIWLENDQGRAFYRIWGEAVSTLSYTKVNIRITAVVTPYLSVKWTVDFRAGDLLDGWATASSTSGFGHTIALMGSRNRDEWA